MQLITSPITNIISISEELYILTCFFPELVYAGQFIMINIPDNSKILPRPISIFNYDTNTKLLSLLIRTRGTGTHILSQSKIGDKISLFGPCGQGFDTTLTNQNIVLIGGGEGIAPMLITSEALKINNTISIFAGFRYQEEACILEYFDQNLLIQYTAQDHKDCNSRSFVTSLLNHISAPDHIFTCGPIPMMKAIYSAIKKNQWETKLFISMESHMACGVGACMGCTISDKYNKAQKVCTDGPIFNAKDIFNE